MKEKSKNKFKKLLLTEKWRNINFMARKETPPNIVIGLLAKIIRYQTYQLFRVFFFLMYQLFNFLKVIVFKPSTRQASCPGHEVWWQLPNGRACALQ